MISPTRKFLRQTLSLSLLTLCSAAALGADTSVDTANVSPQIIIVRSNGKEDGVAQMVVKGKTHKITANALQAWSVREGQGAVILVVEQKRPAAKRYVLRYYDLDSGRRRILGNVPFK